MSDQEATFYDIGHGISETEASQMFARSALRSAKVGNPLCRFFRTAWCSN